MMTLVNGKVASWAEEKSLNPAKTQKASMYPYARRKPASGWWAGAIFAFGSLVAAELLMGAGIYWYLS